MVTRHDGSFVTQRDLPRMALIDVGLSGHELELYLPGHGSTRLPLSHEDTPYSTVRVWSDDVRASVHAGGSEWIGRALGGDYQLVYMPDDVTRPVNPARAAPGDIVSFADGYPLLLATEASLADLNTRLPSPIGIRRFRPNLVIAGSPPYAEDDWKRIRVGELEFRVPKGCDRCKVTTIDPETAEQGVEPLRTLASYRKWDGKVWFGVNLIPNACGTLQVGDAVAPIG
jgi:uncharacterized protein YcbX